MCVLKAIHHSGWDALLWWEGRSADQFSGGDVVKDKPFYMRLFKNFKTLLGNTKVCCFVFYLSAVTVYRGPVGRDCAGVSRCIVVSVTASSVTSLCVAGQRIRRPIRDHAWRASPSLHSADPRQDSQHERQGPPRLRRSGSCPLGKGA